MSKLEVLKNVFGYDSFREGQEQIVDAILKGQDVLGIMPTGAGKSICYQLPALMLQGITIVVSPLISLMIDQVKALNEDMEEIIVEGEELLARCLLHEIDHLDGVMYVDKAEGPLMETETEED